MRNTEQVSGYTLFLTVPLLQRYFVMLRYFCTHGRNFCQFMQVDVAQGHSLVWHDTTKTHKRKPNPFRARTAKENSGMFLGAA